METPTIPSLPSDELSEQFIAQHDHDPEVSIGTDIDPENLYGAGDTLVSEEY